MLILFSISRNNLYDFKDVRKIFVYVIIRKIYVLVICLRMVNMEEVLFL